MLPNREGRFKATIVEHGVAETGPNNLATFVCQFHLVQELANGEWYSVEEDFDITGYFYLEKRDGALNAMTVDALKSAFGWDGRDPFWLQDADFNGLFVQVKLAFETYDGQTRIKVKYVDAENAAPAEFPKANDNTRRSISTRLGSKLRANAGGTPAPAPKPGPASRPAPPKPQAPDATPASSGVTMQQAWEAFVKACPAGAPQEQVEGEWFRILGELHPGKQPEQLSPAEWTKFIDDAPGLILPF